VRFAGTRGLAQQGCGAQQSNCRRNPIHARTAVGTPAPPHRSVLQATVKAGTPPASKRFCALLALRGDGLAQMLGKSNPLGPAEMMSSMAGTEEWWKTLCLPDGQCVFGAAAEPPAELFRSGDDGDPETQRLLQTNGLRTLAFDIDGAVARDSPGAQTGPAATRTSNKLPFADGMPRAGYQDARQQPPGAPLSMAMGNLDSMASPPVPQTPAREQALTRADAYSAGNANAGGPISSRGTAKVTRVCGAAVPLGAAAAATTAAGDTAAGEAAANNMVAGNTPANGMVPGSAAGAPAGDSDPRRPAAAAEPCAASGGTTRVRRLAVLLQNALFIQSTLCK
jgi:hypothetical protein